MRVPAGTTVRDIKTGEEVADLVTDGAEIVAARGGKGGRGNARFVTSTRRAPRIAMAVGIPCLFWMVAALETAHSRPWSRVR